MAKKFYLRTLVSVLIMERKWLLLPRMAQEKQPYLKF